MTQYVLVNKINLQAQWVINFQLWKEICLGRETLQMFRALWSTRVPSAPWEGLPSQSPRQLWATVTSKVAKSTTSSVHRDAKPEGRLSSEIWDTTATSVFRHTNLQASLKYWKCILTILKKIVTRVIVFLFNTVYYIFFNIYSKNKPNVLKHLGREQVDSEKVWVCSTDGSQCKLHIPNFKVPCNCNAFAVRKQRHCGYSGEIC